VLRSLAWSTGKLTPAVITEMKPLLSQTEDQDSLQALGRASVQIVHDLKNQLNGLKLYATFLRKRMEKSDRPLDEQETIAKLMAGIERAASDLSTLVQFGRPIELKKQPGVDLQKLMRGVVTTLSDIPLSTGALNSRMAVETTNATLTGDFDPVLLAEALKAISVWALKVHQTKDAAPLPVELKRHESASEAIIEWRGLSSLDHDPFASFAGSDEIRMSLAAKIINAHGGTAKRQVDTLSVSLPITT
jgi:light-regulated signal transduction histidine kinase (bacteriophytochrome)